MEGRLNEPGAAPRVSVVTPVYNGGRFLDECIGSVLAQTYGDFEYVVCDDHSTDDTREILARHAAADPRIRIVRPDRHLPQVEHWNFALGSVSPASAFVKVVHADDTLAPTCLERLVALAEANPSVAMVGALRLVGDGEVDLDGIPPTVEVVDGRWLLRHQLRGGPYTTGPPTATLLRASALGELRPPYDPSYVHADDWLSFRMLLAGDFGYVPEVLSYTRLHSASVTSWGERIGTWTPEHLRLLLRFGPEVLTPAELQRVAVRRERDYARLLAKAFLALRPWRDRELRRFHRRVLGALQAEAPAAGRELPWPLRLAALLLGCPPGGRRQRRD